MAQKDLGEAFLLDAQATSAEDMDDWVATVRSSRGTTRRRKDAYEHAPSPEKQIRCLKAAMNLIQNHATITNCMGVS
eukprot:753450-Hanusia_phi.AAC.1